MIIINKCNYHLYSCNGCVGATGICGWCQLDFTCTGDNTTCTGGPTNWLTVSDITIIFVFY